MASKIMTFRLPEGLAEEIASRAQQSGKDKTAIVVEILTKAFGLPAPSPAPITVDKLQQQLTYLQNTVVDLSQRFIAYRQNQPSESEDETLYRIARLEQAIASFRLQSTAAFSDDTDLSPREQTEELISLTSAYFQLSEGDSRNTSFAEERLQLIEQIRQQAKTLDQILSASPDLIYVVDQTGRFAYVNLTYARAFGIERKDILGKTSQELVGSPGLLPEPLKQIIAQRDAIFLEGQSTSSEVSFSTANGTVTYEYSLSPIYGVNGAINSVVCTARNITQRKQTEVALRESEAKYRALFELANDSIFIVDATTLRILNANWNAIRRLGYTRQELLQLSIRDIDVPMTKTRHQAILRELQSRGNVIFEHASRCKDGSTLPVEVSIRVIEYEGRLAYLCFDRDITERKQAEEALRQSSDRLSLAMEVGQLGWWDWNLATNETVLSPQNAFIFGYEPEKSKATYADWASRVHPEDLSRLEAMIQAARVDQQDCEYEYRILLPDGSLRWVKDCFRCYYDAEGQPIRALGIATDITARKQAEEHLRLLESAIFNANDAILITKVEPLDEPGPEIVYVNQGFTRMTGYSPEEVIGRSPRFLQGPETDRSHLDAIRAALVRQEPITVEMLNYRKDGFAFWVELSIVPITNDAGHYTHLLGIQRDITARKQTESEIHALNAELERRVLERTIELSYTNAALEESEAHLRGIFEQAAVGICTTAFSGQLTRVNQRYCDILGYSEAELLERTFQEITHPGDVQADMDQARQLSANEIPRYSMEKRYIRKDGRVQWARISASLVRDVSGKPDYFITIIEDIQERKQAEEALCRSEEQLRIVFERAAIGITWTNGDDQFLQVNPWFCEMVGYTETELLQMTFHDITHPEDLAVNREYSRQLWAGEISTFSLEKRYFRKDGQLIWVEVNGSLVCDSNGAPQYSIGIIEDISDRIKSRD